MPTDLPFQFRARPENTDLAGSTRALLRFYVGVGLLLFVLVVGERYSGMFAGLTPAESFLKATSNDGDTTKTEILAAVGLSY